MFIYAHSDGAGTIYVKKPYDGCAAIFRNGIMFAFEFATQQLVRDLYAAGREAGGSDEGAPGFRDGYSEHFYVGYLRDDVGNKIALFCKNPDEASRKKLIRIAEPTSESGPSRKVA